MIDNVKWVYIGYFYILYFIYLSGCGIVYEVYQYQYVVGIDVWQK